MSCSGTRGFRLLKAIEYYVKNHPNQFDTSTVLNKVKFTSASEGQINGSFIVDSAMCNSGNTLHGGYIAAVMDLASLFGQMSLPNGKLAWTTSMNIVFLKAAFKGDVVSIQTAAVSGLSKNLVMETHLLNNTSGGIVAKGTVVLLQGHEKYQKMTKEVMNFDVYEQ